MAGTQIKDLGDITKQTDVDAIVNAANESLLWESFRDKIANLKIKRLSEP